MIVDVHCHYTLLQRLANVTDRFSFEPAELNGQPAFDSCVSPRFRRRMVWPVLCRMLGLDPEAKRDPDPHIEKFYEQHLLADGPVERAVLLAFDTYHDDDGTRTPWPQGGNDLGGDIYTTNTLIRDMCRRHPQRYLFGASVHPYRTDAVQCVEEVYAAGACLLKWIPLHQNIDVFDPRTLAVLRRCAELGLPVLAHYGGEFTLAIQHPAYGSVTPLLEVLRRLRREGQMPITIVGHVATPVTVFGARDSYRALAKAMLGEFADAPLYADISAMTAWGKAWFGSELARRQELHAKLLFGTDFPVLPGLPQLRWLLGRQYKAIAAEPSWIQQSALVYQHVGFNEIVFHRAAELLPNVDFFTRTSAVA